MKQKISALNLIGKLLFETMAVVIGVSIAFFVDNWKDDHKATQNEIKLLQALRNDIVSDSLNLNENVKMLDLFMSTYQRISVQGFSKDSTLTEIDRLITYSSYRPINLSYKEMQQTGNSGNITNKELLYALILLNEKLMGIIEEGITVDRSFVLDRMIPFMEKNAAYPYDARATAAMLSNNEFKNLLRSSMLFKGIDKAGLTLYKRYTAQVIAKIDAELEQLRN